MAIKANLGLVMQGLKGAGKDIASYAKTKIKKPVKAIRQSGRAIRRNPIKSTVIGAGAAGTGFYLYGGNRNAYEDSAGRAIRRNPIKSTVIGAGAAGTGFYLYGGNRNAYEDSDMK